MKLNIFMVLVILMVGIAHAGPGAGKVGKGGGMSAAWQRVFDPSV
jgi:hypothetical protein